jgi:L-aspartate oxidase
MKHIIVVGSGIAGLIAALELSRKHSITLVTKARLEDSNTRFAQGGIAAAMFSDDSVAEHIADTLRAGAGLCDPGAVEVLCSEGPARIRDLVRLGVDFDQHNGELARGSKRHTPALACCTPAATPPGSPSSWHWLALFAQPASQ